MNNAKKPLRHHGNDYKGLHSDTVCLRWTHVIMSESLSTTQAWSWDDGDAIVVVSGPRGEAWTAIRNEGVVTAVPGSLNDAMGAIGLDPNEFEIQ